MSESPERTPELLTPKIGRFLTTAFQLGLLTLAIRLFGIEKSFGFVEIAPVIFFGFCVHAWLGPALRLPFFLALSLCAIFVVLGLSAGAILILIALGLVTICHLPIPYSVRLILVFAAVGVLAAFRLNWIEASWSATVLPVVGAMFMFRLIIYLYDLRNEKETVSIWHRLSYFFMLPNVCFPLFPVVDYRTFLKTYCDDQRHRIHQRGIQWMLRGIVHLLLYRAVYFYLAPPASEVEDLGGMALFAVTSYLLYLRVSGQFHLIVGILHLFGFHLPQTNNKYFLASSFTDCWRRINIYWIDFMKKIIYYPAFVRLRRRGMVFGMVASTAIVFICTWLLHSYQWFWLRGSFPFTPMDGLFWGVLGTLAVLGTVWELKHPKRGKPEKGRLSPVRALRRSAQALGVFCFICVLWSLWCSESLAQWGNILLCSGNATTEQVSLLLLAIAAILAIGTAAQIVADREWLKPVMPGPAGWTLLTTAGALVLPLFGFEEVRASLGPSFDGAVTPIVENFMNRRDRQRMVIGYYEGLLDRGGFDARVVEKGAKKPSDWAGGIFNTPMARPTNDVRRHELVPSSETLFKGALVNVNRWGMRDREYSMEKPPNTFRIAILGSSYEMGSGVSNEEVWEEIVEDRLNSEGPGASGKTYELLNFSVPSYRLVQHVMYLPQKVAAFEPDVVVLSSHVRVNVKTLSQLVDKGLRMPVGLDRIVESTNVKKGDGVDTIMRALDPLRKKITEWGLRRIMKSCEKIGAIPVYMNAPYSIQALDQIPEWDLFLLAEAIEAAEPLGYEFLGIEDVFNNTDFESIIIASWDHHPNAKGHRLMADGFYEELIDNPHLLGLMD